MFLNNRFGCISFCWITLDILGSIFFLLFSNYTSKIVSSQKLTKASSFSLSPSSFTTSWRKARLESWNNFQGTRNYATPVGFKTRVILTSKIVSSQKLIKQSSFPLSPPSLTMLCKNVRLESWNGTRHMLLTVKSRSDLLNPMFLQDGLWVFCFQYYFLCSADWFPSEIRLSRWHLNTINCSDACFLVWSVHIWETAKQMSLKSK